MRDVPFFGELYRRTTTPLLSETVTRAEAQFIASTLELRPGLRTLDVGCGEGRHLSRLSSTGARLTGVDFDDVALGSAGRHAGVAVGDLRALPISTASMDRAYCWYTTLFVFDEAGNQAALREVARVLAPRGRFLFQSVNPEHLAAEPAASFEVVLPDGARIHEQSQFDAAAGVDRGERTLEVGGEILRGHYRLRYYRLEELTALFAGCGLRIARVFGSVQGDASSPDSLDLIVLADREP